MLTAEQKRILGHYKNVASELRARAENGDGTLSGQEMGNCKYCEFPFLLLETDEAIAERMADVMNNVMDIGEDGKMVPSLETRLNKHDEIYWGLMNEVNMRQLHQLAFTPLVDAQRKYYINGAAPVGLKMFENAGNVPSEALVKFSEAQYVEKMIEQGEFRIAPAKYYKDDAPEDAMRDDETNRPFKIKALDEVLEGQTSIDFSGQTIQIENGFIEVSTPIENYYMFCTCTYFSRRMPTDFNSNAALIIENPPEFIKRMKAAVAEQLSNFKFFADKVSYYDPYNDIPNPHNAEFNKHFSYAYQKEHRCVWRYALGADIKILEPIFVKLGPLHDIARPVYV